MKHCLRNFCIARFTGLLKSLKVIMSVVGSNRQLTIHAFIPRGWGTIWPPNGCECAPRHGLSRCRNTILVGSKLKQRYFKRLFLTKFEFLLLIFIKKSQRLTVIMVMDLCKKKPTLMVAFKAYKTPSSSVWSFSKWFFQGYIHWDPKHWRNPSPFIQSFIYSSSCSLIH